MSSLAIGVGNRNHSADGFDVPPFIVNLYRFKASTWYTQGGMPASWAIKPTSNGWTDNETGLDWIKHFNKHTKDRRHGSYRMLVLDGHESHRSVDFEDYCKQQNIIPICLPPHSSHLSWYQLCHLWLRKAVHSLCISSTIAR